MGEGSDWSVRCVAVLGADRATYRAFASQEQPGISWLLISRNSTNSEITIPNTDSLSTDSSCPDAEASGKEISRLTNFALDLSSWFRWTGLAQPSTRGLPRFSMY